jgi:hypothetical protein
MANSTENVQYILDQPESLEDVIVKTCLKELDFLKKTSCLE